MIMELISLFSGCGGLDLGFERAGFDVVYANEYNTKITPTYRRNFNQTLIDTRSVSDISADDFPSGNCGLIGSAPCQSWSEAGKGRGFGDPRGKLFWDYVRLIKDRQPVFFVSENVSGMLHASKRASFDNVMASLAGVGYIVSYQLVDVADYGIPQNRERVFIVGLRSCDFQSPFAFPQPDTNQHPITLRDAIGDLGEPIAIMRKASEVKADRHPPNHEYMVGSWSSHFMARQRIRSWDQIGFTVQATARHAPLHPQASKMIRMGVDHFEFDPNSPAPYRRMSVRECARLQTFPDDFIFEYDQIELGYTMVGNAVPVQMAHIIANEVAKLI